MLIEQLHSDLKNAMLAKDRVRTQTIRFMRAALLEKEIELRTHEKKELSESDVMAVIQKQAKQRRDSIEQFSQAGREDLAETERLELGVIESYLPEQLSEDDIRREVRSVIEDVHATSMKDMGLVMSPLMKRLKGQADGRIVQSIVKEALTS